ncbi:MAG: VOC family protein [Spirochaetales bacterium]|nr:VOC family protein [Spirochaetales bacterium]
MQTTVTPCLNFNNQAVEAAEYYTSLFPESRITTPVDKNGAPPDMITFDLWEQKFHGRNKGSGYRFSPALSFMVNFDPLFFPKDLNPEQAARDRLTQLWNELSREGKILMELGSYDFSPLFGWVEDKYGLSWQLILTDPGGDPRPPLMPSFLFVGENCGRAEEAGKEYVSLFPHGKRGLVVPYPEERTEDNREEREGTIMFSDFKLGQTWFTAMDSALDHQFSFTKGVSFLITCDSEEEAARYGRELSRGGEREGLSGIRDRFGVCWEIKKI